MITNPNTPDAQQKVLSPHCKNSFYSSKHHMIASNITILLMVMGVLIVLVAILETISKRYISTEVLEILPGVVYFSITTLKKIIWYILAVPCVFMFFLYIKLTKYFFIQQLEYAIKHSNCGFIPYLVSLAVFIGFILLGVVLHKTLQPPLMWLSVCIITPLLLWPVMPEGVIRVMRRLISVFCCKKWYAPCLIALSLVYLLWLFKPFIFDNFIVINEYWDIPVETQLSAAQDSEVSEREIVDSIDFINENNILGFNYKYDIRTPYTDTINQAKMIFSDYSQQDNVKEFIKINQHELHWMNLGRGFIHHHNHVVTPVSEYHLGKPMDTIFCQYGLLNMVFFEKILSMFDSLDYNGYAKVLYGSHFVYLLIFLIVTGIITQSGTCVAIMALSLVGLMHFSSFVYFYLGPGLKAFRYFFDIIVVLLAYKYFVNNKKVYLLLALVVGLLAIANNLEFGIMIFLALLGTIFLRNFGRNFFCFETIIGVLFSCAAILIFYTISSFDSLGYSKLFLSGLLAFPFSNSLIYWLLLSFFLLYCFYLYLEKINAPASYIFLLCNFYCQGLTLYWIRSFAPYHVVLVLPFWLLMLLIAISILKKRYGQVTKIQPALVCAAAIVAVFYAPSYYEPYSIFKRNAQNNILYKWELPFTNFYSDMNPLYFTDSVELIHKYSDEEKGIYLISKYDTILPLISERYNKISVVDLQNFLITEDIFIKLVNFIEIAKPEIIFVDVDLVSRDFFQDTISPKNSPISYLSQESIWRAERLTQVQRLFFEVIQNYEPVENSLLLTVYKRKDMAELPSNSVNTE